MAEMDYIERRKLWDEVVKSKTSNPHLNEIQRQAHIHEHRAFQRMIIEQPAADVVKVVRCEDCKHNADNGGDCDRVLIHTHRNLITETNEYQYFKLNYCEYGTPKERGGEK